MSAEQLDKRIILVLELKNKIRDYPSTIKWIIQLGGVQDGGESEFIKNLRLF